LNEDCVEAARSVLGSMFDGVLTSRKAWLNVLWNDASGRGMLTSINSFYFDMMFALTSRSEGNGCAQGAFKVAGCHGVYLWVVRWKRVVNGEVRLIRQTSKDTYSSW
jgi:hypothetical protein